MKAKIIMLFMLVSFISYGQSSPAETATGTVKGTDVTVTYSSPRVKGRTVYGGLVPFDKVWRAGANKNTTVTFSKDVKVEGKSLKAGTYGFFVIPTESGKWTAIFNKTNDSWGASKYVETDDALRVEVSAKKASNKEELTYAVTKRGISFTWGDKTFSLKVK